MLTTVWGNQDWFHIVHLCLSWQSVWYKITDIRCKPSLLIQLGFQTLWGAGVKWVPPLQSGVIINGWKTVYYNRTWLEGLWPSGNYMNSPEKLGKLLRCYSHDDSAINEIIKITICMITIIITAAQNAAYFIQYNFSILLLHNSFFLIQA